MAMWKMVIEAAQRLNLARIDLAESSVSHSRVAGIIATIKKSIALLCSSQVHSSLFFFLLPPFHSNQSATG